MNRFILVCFMLSQSMFALGQKDDVFKDDRFIDRFFFGGAFGLTFGSVTQIDVLPIAGAWIFPQWSLGASGRYSYYSNKGYYMGGTSNPYRSHIWGTSVFTQVLPVPDFSEVTSLPIKGGLLLHGEVEWLYMDRRMIDPLNNAETGKTWTRLYLAGVGYRQKLGERAALNILLLWNVSSNSYSPYPTNPMLRVNFTL